MRNPTGIKLCISPKNCLFMRSTSLKYTVQIKAVIKLSMTNYLINLVGLLHCPLSPSFSPVMILNLEWSYTPCETCLTLSCLWRGGGGNWCPWRWGKWDNIHNTTPSPPARCCVKMVSGGGGGRGRLYLTLHHHHLHDAALRWAVVRTILMVH